MPLIATFDGQNRRFYLDGANILPVNGIPTMSVNMQAFYSEFVVWLNQGFPNTRWIEALRATGGDLSGPGQRDGTRVFFMNNWEIVPADESHTLILQGAVSLDAATNTSNKFLDFQPLSGTSRVSVVYQQPVITQVVETSGGSGSSGSGDASLSNQIAMLSNQNVLLTRSAKLDALVQDGAFTEEALTNSPLPPSAALEASVQEALTAIAALSDGDATETNQTAILSAIAQLQTITAELHTFRGLNAAKPISRDKTGNTTTESDGTVTLTHTANPSNETVSTQRSG